MRPPLFLYALLIFFLLAGVAGRAAGQPLPEQTMKPSNFALTFSVSESPDDVFKAIVNPRAWWSQAIEGETDRRDAVFYYHYRDVHRCTFKIVECQPGKRVVWHVLDNTFNFIRDQAEWRGTDVVFDIVRKGGQTEVHFTHVGLVPANECYTICSDAWSRYIKSSLVDLIKTGRGQPNPIEAIVSRAQEMQQANEAEVGNKR